LIVASEQRTALARYSGDRQPFAVETAMGEYATKPRHPAMPLTAPVRRGNGSHQLRLAAQSSQLNAGAAVNKLTSLGAGLAQRPVGQQANLQERYRPVVQMKTGVPVNDDAALEREADRMGALALTAPTQLRSLLDRQPSPTRHAAVAPVQLHAMPFTGVDQRITVVQREGNGTLIGGGAVVGGVGLLIGTIVNPGLGTIIGAGIGGLIGILGGYVYNRLVRKPAVPWIFYINPKDFAKAVELREPGLMYDKEQSKGYQASMVKALQDELFGAKLGGRVDYAEYERLHNVVTSKLEVDEKFNSTSLKSIRTPSSFDQGTEFPINDWDEKPTDPAEDLQHETIGGLPMVTPLDVKAPSNEQAREQDRQPSVTMYDQENGGAFLVRYSEKEGVAIVEQILDRYYREIAAAQHAESREEKEEIKLTAIVKVIRALHVTHPFKDANGRLHVQLLLNRFLLEQGFPTSIMPFDKGLGVFGGAFSLSELKKFVREGFARKSPPPLVKKDEKDEKDKLL
jgi:hypothetical protein